MRLTAAAEQSLHCLLTEISMENAVKNKRHPPETPNSRNKLVQMIKLDKSTGQRAYNLYHCDTCLEANEIGVNIENSTLKTIITHF